MLPPFYRTETSEELEYRLMFATELHERLLHNVEPRFWMIKNEAGEKFHHMVVLEDGSYLVCLASTGFICADLRRHEWWRMPLEQTVKPGHTFDAISYRKDGRDGIVIVYATENSFSSYLYSFDARFHPGISPFETIHSSPISIRHLISSVILIDTTLLVTCKPSHVVAIDINTLQRREFSVSGSVMSVSLVPRNVLIAYEEVGYTLPSQVSIAAHYFALDDDAGRPPIIVNPLGLSRFCFPRDRRYLFDPDDPTMISFMATGFDDDAVWDDGCYVSYYEIDNFLHQALSSDKDAPDPNIPDIQSPLFKECDWDHFPYRLPKFVSRGSGLFMDCGSFGPSQAICTVSCGYNNEAPELVISSFNRKNETISLRHVVIPEPEVHIVVGEVEYNEATGRICLASCWPGNPLVILEL